MYYCLSKLAIFAFNYAAKDGEYDSTKLLFDFTKDCT